MTTSRPYHHGDLAAAILSAAVDVIAESGPAAVSLRDLARRAGVSHAAPAHHFRDKAGLLTAVAVEGYTLLAEALEGTLRSTGDFREMGVAYVRFAIARPGHFQTMFRPDLYDPADPAVLSARERTARALDAGVATLPEETTDPETGLAATAAWSLVHGFATLWLDGSLAPGAARDSTVDPEATARAVVGYLFRG